MNNLTLPSALSDWYELVEGTELMQGNILQGCPVFRPPANLDWPMSGSEHLAQAFARYFMRVGLPVDIPPFKSEKAEAEVMRKLGALDEEARNRIIEAFK